MCNVAAVARTGRAVLAGIVLVAVSAFLAQAEYGPRTTIGENYQQWSDTESPNGADIADCTGTQCYILFQRTPQKKPLIVQHVSCFVLHSPGDLRIAWVGTRRGSELPLRAIYLVPVATVSGTWAISGPVAHLLKSGERGYVAFESTESGTWGPKCSITGTLIEP